MAARVAMETAIQEIRKGEELMNSLQSHLHPNAKASGLSKGILQALAGALSILESKATDDKIGSAAKRQPAAPGDDDEGRGHKRRRFSNSKAILTPTPHLDGHQWRKYGQKRIQRSNYPRDYYRCTYRDQGCLATKLVQEEEHRDGVPMFRVIYINQHTCINAIPDLAPQIVFGSPPQQSDFFIFESKDPCRGLDINKEQFVSLNPKKEESRILLRESDCPSIMNFPVSNLEKAKMEDDSHGNSITEDFPLSPTRLLEPYGFDFEGDDGLISSFLI